MPDPSAAALIAQAQTIVPRWRAGVASLANHGWLQSIRRKDVEQCADEVEPTIRDLLALLAATTHARDAALTFTAHQGIVLEKAMEEYRHAKDRVEQAESRLTQLRAYVQHLPSCADGVWGCGYGPCSCGLTALLDGRP